MTIDDIRKLAEDAKAWRPGVHATGPECGAGCPCLGAKRAVEWISEEVDGALNAATIVSRLVPGRWGSNRGAVKAAVGCAEIASRVAGCFTSEPNPVSIFRDAVKAFVK